MLNFNLTFVLLNLWQAHLEPTLYNYICCGFKCKRCTLAFVVHGGWLELQRNVLFFLSSEEKVIFISLWDATPLRIMAMSLLDCCWLCYGKSNLINVLVRTDVSSNRPNQRKRRSSNRVSRTRVHKPTMARSNPNIHQPASSKVTRRTPGRAGAPARRSSTRTPLPATTTSEAALLTPTRSDITTSRHAFHSITF